MNNNELTYRIWAPDNALWTDWAKPVLFTSWPSQDNKMLNVPAVKWARSADMDTAVIVDLPGQQSVAQGLGLARLGYRPVPLYNGVTGPDQSSMIVPAGEIASALYKGAHYLSTLTLHPLAPPVFLLDSNRMQGGGRQPGKYDNRWCVFPQDMPSASFLAERGIRRVVVCSARIESDLSHILCRYQEQGLSVELCNGVDAPKGVKVTRPSRFKSFFYRYSVTAGLTRNAAGGFGGMVPEPTQSGSGVRHYGMG